jgi:hypothetical protein
MVHRIVLTTFQRPPKSWEQCNHKDGNKHNNELSNLEWVTGLENARHAVEVLDSYKRGQTHGRSKLTEREAAFIVWLKGTYGDTIQPKPIADFYGMSSTSIQYLWKGKSWKCLQK